MNELTLRKHLNANSNVSLLYLTLTYSIILSSVTVTREVFGYVIQDRLYCIWLQVICVFQTDLKCSLSSKVFSSSRVYWAEQVRSCSLAVEKLSAVQTVTSDIILTDSSLSRLWYGCHHHAPSKLCAAINALLTENLPLHRSFGISFAALKITSHWTWFSCVELKYAASRMRSEGKITVTKHHKYSAQVMLLCFIDSCVQYKMFYAFCVESHTWKYLCASKYMFHLNL